VSLVISVAICTHNPRRDYLERALHALSIQTLPKRSWELLIVDNASRDVVARGYDLSWHPNARHLREETLGLTSARFRAIAAACGDLIVFVDDDNVLARDYLEEAVRLAEAFPHLGVFGSGCLEAQFEIPPPPALRPHLSLLGIRTISAPLWSYHAADHAMTPWGAGLVATRIVASRYQQFTERLNITLLLGRRGRALYSGEDELFSSLAIRLGLGFGIFPQLQITHLIGRHRLNRPYMRQMAYDHAVSSRVRQYVVTGVVPRRLDWFDCAHVLLHGLRRGSHSMRCRWAELSGEDRAARLIADWQLQPISSEPDRRPQLVQIARNPLKRSAS
jgi:glycosyltransferase involved in cell wall biosynthesis